MSWLSAMPLLSTLAALVIIVHSAEELERERVWSGREEQTGVLEREIRDTDYEQPWRAIDAEPILQPTTTPDAWVSSENAPRRRRFSRKRKRRPQMPERIVGQDKYLFQGEQRRPDIEYRDTNHALRRRRLPALARAEESDVTWAKRGVQNRQLSNAYDTWVEPEELEQGQSNEQLPEIKANSAENRFLEGYNHFVQRKYSSDSEPKLRPTLDENTKDTIHKSLKINTDKSLSDLSSESRDEKSFPRFSHRRYNKRLDKPGETTTLVSNMEVPQPKSTLSTHAVTIKEILKRSKGKSLSEILEQHKLSLSDLLQGKINPMTILKSIGETSRSKPSQANSNDGSQQNEKIDETPELEPVIDSEETTVSALTKKTYKKAKPIDDDYPEIIQDEAVIDEEATTEDTYTNNRIPKNNTSGYSMLLKQKKRPKQRISFPNLSTKPPPPSLSRQTTPKNKNLPKPRKGSKTGEWKDVLPKLLPVHPASSTEYKDDMYEDRDVTASAEESTEATSTQKIITTNTEPEEDEELTTTTVYNAPYNTPERAEWVEVENSKLVSEAPETTTETEPTTEMESTTTTTTTTTTTSTTTAFPRVMHFRRPTSNATALRQQVFTNRMKKKRLRQKTTSTSTPETLLNDTNLQTASEYIEKLPPTTTTKKPIQTTQSENEIDIEAATSKTQLPVQVTFQRQTTPLPIVYKLFPEKMAKNEIDEILNDTHTSAKLSRILLERNMTLGELVEHRERGSSHVHLADIFHNASKEPSAAEPFLSKSLIEPISKETYPLRAILENQHDSTTRPPNAQEFTQPAYYNIPVVMDFGNNVNENGENMGIMSLFNNYTKTDLQEEVVEKTHINADSEGSLYIPSVAVIPANDSRYGRRMKDSWNDLFAIIKGRRHKNLTTIEIRKEDEPTSGVTKDNSVSDSYKKTSLEEDADGDGLIILEDLQRFDQKTTTSTKAIHLEPNVFHREEDSSNTIEMSGANKASSTTKSVTVATASIIGLAMVLFLLTYALLKWNQQRNMMRDKSKFGNERIATPVFENHKEVAHHNSCRSINSMMSSNIYTVDGFENKNGKESPVYMWDDMKKPFQ